MPKSRIRMRPCPFCGKTSKDATFGHANTGPFVTCPSCGAGGPAGESEVEAICLWNGGRVPSIKMDRGQLPGKYEGVSVIRDLGKAVIDWRSVKTKRNRRVELPEEVFDAVTRAAVWKDVKREIDEALRRFEVQ